MVGGVGGASAGVDRAGNRVRDRLIVSTALTAAICRLDLAGLLPAGVTILVAGLR